MLGFFLIRYDGIDSIYEFWDQNKTIKQKIRGMNKYLKNRIRHKKN